MSLLQSSASTTSPHFLVSRQCIEHFEVDGSLVEKILVSSSSATSSILGIELEVLTYGATISSLKVGGQEVTIGHANEAAVEYKANNNYMGCIAGRFANRICNGKFVLDGAEYQLAVNNGPNALHGGLIGFDKRNWTCEDVIITDNKAAVVMSLVSLDGEEGYPGTVNVQVVYELDVVENSLTIYKNATSDKATPINLTNHAYWNLSGGVRSIKEHHLWLNCDAYLPVNHVQIPTGVVQDVKGSHFDLTTDKLLGEVIPHIDGGGESGLDHCFVINRPKDSLNDLFTPKPVCTKGMVGIIPHYFYRYNDGPYPPLNEAVRLRDSAGGLSMTVHTTQPGVQVYSGNFLPKVKPSSPTHALMTQHNAVCLETQHFPDSINQPSFPTVVLHPESLYRHYSIFKFTKQ